MNIVRTLLLAATCLATVVLAGITSAYGSEKLSNGLYAKIKTNRGDIVVRLAYDKAPLTVCNFVSLAEGTKKCNKPMGTHFYDGLKFHRVISRFMIQGGDPAGDGTGGPGYKFADEFAPGLRHNRAGTMSMANSGPNTNGSQFFITHVPTPHLDNKHSVFGYVVKGQNVVNAIRKGDSIIKVTIIRKGKKAKKFATGEAAFQKLSGNATPQAGDTAKPGSVKQTASYGIGMSIGSNMRRQGLTTETIDIESLYQGLQDALAGKRPRISQAELGAAMQQFQRRMTARMSAGADVNQKASDRFLAANAKKTGIITTASGLQYKVLKTGTGASPTRASRVKVHYTGTLISGKVFDSSVTRGTPATFTVGQVIKGWQEALTLMKPGGKLKVFIPPALGYGKRGSPPVIPPNSALIFEIELLDIL